MISDSLLEKGVNFFNDGHYFEAHEVWEDLWRETHGPLRRFYQGLIQAAVGLYHLNRSNRRGGLAQLNKAVVNLRGCEDTRHGLDAAGLILQLEAVLAQDGPWRVRIARWK